MLEPNRCCCCPQLRAPVWPPAGCAYLLLESTWAKRELFLCRKRSSATPAKRTISSSSMKLKQWGLCFLFSLPIKLRADVHLHCHPSTMQSKARADADLAHEWYCDHIRRAELWESAMNRATRCFWALGWPSKCLEHNPTNGWAVGECRQSSASDIPNRSMLKWQNNFIIIQTACDKRLCPSEHRFCLYSHNSKPEACTSNPIGSHSFVAILCCLLEQSPTTHRCFRSPKTIKHGMARIVWILKFALICDSQQLSPVLFCFATTWRSMRTTSTSPWGSWNDFSWNAASDFSSSTREVNCTRRSSLVCHTAMSAPSQNFDWLLYNRYAHTRILSWSIYWIRTNAQIVFV